MADAPQSRADQPDELFGRWLAHREQSSGDPTPEAAAAPAPTPAPVDPLPDARPAPVAPVGPVARAVAARAGTAPALGEAVAPSNFGVRRVGHTATPGVVNELDRQPPPGWEPVVMRSVQKKAEKQQRKHAAAPPADRPGRLQRLKARIVDVPADDAEPTTDGSPIVAPAARVAQVAPVAQVPVAVAPVVPPAPKVPARPAARAASGAPSAVTIGEAIVAAVRPAPVPTPSPTAPPTAPPPAPRAAPEPAPEPEPVVEPEPTADRERPALLRRRAERTSGAPTRAASAARELVAERRRDSPPRARRPKPTPPAVPPPPLVAGAPAPHQVAQTAAALIETPVVAPVVAPVRQRAPVRVPAPPTPEPAARASEQMPVVYEFRPKRLSRILLTLAFLGGLVATAYYGLAAYEVRDNASIGIAAICGLATAVVWAIRAGAAVDVLTVRSGQLEVVRQGGRYVFDLASAYTVIEVHGKPGQRRWKVLFPRRGMTPFAVDASMVDPRDFMRVLLFFRPDVPQFKR